MIEKGKKIGIRDRHFLFHEKTLARDSNRVAVIGKLGNQEKQEKPTGKQRNWNEISHGSVIA